METFPTELGILTCLALFAASMWIPFIVGVVRQPDVEGVDNFDHQQICATCRLGSIGRIALI